MSKKPFLPRRLAQHPWNVSVKRAASIQNELSKYVRLTPLVGTPNLVAGVDTAFDEERIFVAIVVMDWTTGKIVEIQCGEGGGRWLFPYTPGYRAYREVPTILKAASKLYRKPDLFFVAGHGMCHPRMCGNATHAGILLNRPTIGCARERLVGHYEPPGEEKGDYSVLRYSPQAPGVVLRTRRGANPIFVSPGHNIDLLGAIEQTMRCTTRYRLPEPLRRAHVEAGRYMRTKREQKS